MRTSVSKSTSVMSTACSIALRNLIAAVRTSLMSSSMLPLASSRNPMCSGGAVSRIAGGEELDRLRLAGFLDLEVVGRQTGDRTRPACR